jgi:uncharacterized protein (DUF305 family)
MKFRPALTLLSTIILYCAGAIAQTPPTTSSGDASNKQGMGDMSSMAMSGDADKDFAMMMKMHHQKGLEMARKELANGKSPEMKAMAKKIVDAQTKEIAELDRYLATHS